MRPLTLKSHPDPYCLCQERRLFGPLGVEPQVEFEGPMFFFCIHLTDFVEKVVSVVIIKVPTFGLGRHKTQPEIFETTCNESSAEKQLA